MTTIPLPSPKNGIRLVLDHRKQTLSIIGARPSGMANDAADPTGPNPLDSLKELLTATLAPADCDTAFALLEAIVPATGADSDPEPHNDQTRTDPGSGKPFRPSAVEPTDAHDRLAMDNKLGKHKAGMKSLFDRFPDATRMRAQ